MEELDITQALFPQENLTLEEQQIETRKWDLYRLAEEKAFKRISKETKFNPLRLLEESDKIYRAYLKKEKLKYNEERGF